MAKPGSKKGAGRVLVGVGGWTYEPWRGAFYPKGLPHSAELAHASSRLTTIEINGTFYRTQTPTTFARWRDETPDDFVFSVKAPRFIVQKRALAETGEQIARFIDSGLPELGGKLGPILWQFAPTKTFDPADFSKFLKLLPREIGGRAARHALEVRHPSFDCARFVALARTHGAAIVTACDSPYPQIADATADFAYLRLMGAQERLRRGYGPKALDAWAGRLVAMAHGAPFSELATIGKDSPRGARDVFCYFISGFKAHNPAAAVALLARLART